MKLKPSYKKTTVIARAVALATLLMLPPFALAQTLDKSIDADVGAQPVSTALIALSKQAGVQILMPGKELDKFKTPGLHGHMSLREALNKLLSGTRFGFHEAGENTIGIDVPTSTSEPTASKSGSAKSAAPPSSSSGNVEQLDTVVVTGTHISGVGSSPTSPVISIDREEILNRGLTTMEDVLRSLSMNFSNLGSSGFVNSNSGAPRFTNGLTAVNLRGLGPNATLVLIDGQRTVNAPTETGTIVDISKIPVGMIERIDVITGAASAIYGGDAVAGVINIITRKDYSGAETFLGYGNSSSNANSREFRQMFGKGWGSGNITANFNYQKRDPAETSALGITSLDHRSQGGQDYRDFYYTLPGQLLADPYAGTGITIPGAVGDIRSALLPPGNGTAVNVSQLTYITNADFVNHTGNFNLLNGSNKLLENFLTPATKEYSGHLALNQHVNDWIDLTAGVTYSKRESVTENLYSPNREVVPASNAYNHFGQDVEVAFNWGNVVKNLPPLATESTSSTVGVNAGATFKLPWRDWRAQLSLDAERAQNNQFQNAFANYLNGFGDAKSLAALQAALSSSDPAHALNLFGDGTVQGANVNPSDFIFKYERGLMVSRLKSANLSFDGTVASLPSGDMKGAIGVEARNESMDFSQYTLDPFYAYGVQPSRDLRAAYGELLVPLAGKNETGADRLLLQVAGRYDKYSIYGPFGDSGALQTRDFSEATPQLGLRWQPNHDWTFKANWAKAFQAPTIQQLFTPADSFPYFTYDPLNPASNGGPGTVPFTYVFGGNPDLKPQTSKSTTLEVGFTPEAVPGLQATVDWSHINVQNVVTSGITTVGSTAEILQNPAMNPGVIRDANGVLKIISYASINAALQKSEAIDFRVSYGFDTAIGTFLAGINGTYTIDLSTQITSKAPTITYSGNVIGPSRWHVLPSLLWNKGDWSANLYLNYYSGVDNTSATSPQKSIASITTVDTQVTWQLPVHGMRLAFGAHNLFDKKPPFYDSTYGIDFSRYNAVGREIYLNYIVSFGDGAR